MNTEYLGFYLKDSLSPIKYLKIRQAINHGFDRKKMLKYLRNNIGTPAVNGFVPRGMPSFDDNLIGFDYDKEKAQKLIEEVKLLNDGNLDPIILSTNSSYLDLCEFIQNELSKIGLEIEINVSPPATHRQMVATSKLSFLEQVGLLIIPMQKIIYHSFTVKIILLMVPTTHILRVQNLMLFIIKVSLKKMIQLGLTYIIKWIK